MEGQSIGWFLNHAGTPTCDGLLVVVLGGPFQKMCTQNLEVHLEL